MPGLLTSNRMKRGVALITAMLVMSLATITAVSMTADQQVYFRRTENILLHEQAYLYLLSAEDFTKVGLAEDYKDNQTDSYNDGWYSESPVVFPVEGGTLSGQVFDMQGKMNINNLAKSQRDPWDEARLLQALRDNDINAELADVILDWLDGDQNPLPAGAESTDYLSGDQPYRAGDGMLGSISELKLLKGMDEQTYEALQKIFIALPSSNVTININTAPPEVLRVIVPGLSEADAKKLSEELKDNPLSEPADLLTHSLVKGAQVDLRGLGTESNYFRLDSMAIVGRATARMQSVIYRQDDKNLRVVMRSQGGL